MSEYLINFIRLICKTTQVSESYMLNGVVTTQHERLSQ